MMSFDTPSNPGRFAYSTLTVEKIKERNNACAKSLFDQHRRRALKIRQMIRIRNQSSTRIQQHYRSYFNRKKYRNKKRSCIVIQKAIRSHLKMRRYNLVTVSNERTIGDEWVLIEKK